jgi:hypothetical protein
LYEGELIKYSDYRKKAVLKTKGLDIDQAGHIVTDGEHDSVTSCRQGHTSFSSKG